MAHGKAVILDDIDLNIVNTISLDSHNVANELNVTNKNSTAEDESHEKET